MMNITGKDLMNAYLEARKSRIPVAKQSPQERAGRFLLLSSSRTSDGDASSQMALRLSLDAGEIEASLALANAYSAPGASPEGSWKAAPEKKEDRASFKVAGDFEVDFFV